MDVLPLNCYLFVNFKNKMYQAKKKYQSDSFRQFNMREVSWHLTADASQARKY